MIFNMVGGGGKRPFLPQYTGKARIVFAGDGSSGYMELYTSGRLTWLDGKHPERADLFCVGGGSGGAHGTGPVGSTYHGGGGGAGGHTTILQDALLVPVVDVVIGAGGLSGNPGLAGGTTSIGALCSAQGGGVQTIYAGWAAPAIGASGGSAGGNGGRGNSSTTTSMRRGGDGGTNGQPPDNAGAGSSPDSGTSQGMPTVDLLGRIHAGGGGGGRGWSGSTPVPGAGGVGGDSDFAEGSGGVNSQTTNQSSTGGGGFGGGGAGGYAGSTGAFTLGGAGGQGFAMIAWGDYA